MSEEWRLSEDWEMSEDWDITPFINTKIEVNNDYCDMFWLEKKEFMKSDNHLQNGL